MMIWLMCWISSLEKAQLHDQDHLKNCDFVFILMLSLSIFILLSHFDKIGLYVIAFSFCYLIVINVTASSVLSYYYIAMVCLNKKKTKQKKK